MDSLYCASQAEISKLQAYLKCCISSPLSSSAKEAAAEVYSKLNSFAKNNHVQDFKVNAGNFESSRIAIDTRSVPSYKHRHQVAVHYDGGIEPKVTVFKGKWRKVKRTINEFLEERRNLIAVDLFAAPKIPVEYINIKFVTSPTTSTG